jgi:hypothetical protein
MARKRLRAMMVWSGNGVSFTAPGTKMTMLQFFCCCGALLDG